MQVTARSGKIEENSLKQVLEKMNDKLNAIINDYNFPNRKVTEEEKRQDMTREEKVNFLEEVGQYKFNSINEIFSMLKSQDKKR